MSFIDHMSDLSLIGRLPSKCLHSQSTAAFGFDDGRKTVKMLNHEKERPLK